MQFARERIHDLWPELEPLFAEHWREIAHYPDIPLAVNHALYEQAEDAGRLRLFTARIDAALVGYALFGVAPAPHYSGSLQACEDVIFVAPAYRGRSIGMRLLKGADESLQAEGVQVVTHHVKLAHRELGQLLTHLGYEPIETIYSRRLD